MTLARWLVGLDARLRDRPPRHVHFWLLAPERYVEERSAAVLYVEHCGGCPARRLPPGLATWR